jgi:putative transposase
MTKHIELKAANQGTALATGTLALPPLVIEGLEEFKGSFDRLCLQAGTAAIEAMLVADANQLCGKRYQRHAGRQGHRWGMTDSEVGWHGGKAAIRRPRVRQRGGAELELPSWTAIHKAELLSRWAFNQMLIGVATRKYARSVRLPDGDLAGQARRATTKSSVSRRFVALSTAKLKEWLAADLSTLDLLVIQIDGLRVGDHVLVAAIGIDGAGDKHVLAVALGATENAAVVKALLADLIERGQVHKGRNIVERLDPSLHAGVKKVLRQAWDSPTAEQAQRVLRNLARRLDHDAPGVSVSILEGLDEMLTVIRIGLPDQLRRSLGCTNAIESLMAMLRTVCRNVKRWRDARMALRWTGTAMLEAEKSFRRLKAHKQLPILRAALLRHQQTLLDNQLLGRKDLAA